MTGGPTPSESVPQPAHRRSAPAQPPDTHPPDTQPPDTQPPERRSPRSVYGVGDEPDPRFSMANERTTLAWMRTALSIVAGGIGLTSLTRLAGLSRVLDVVAIVMCVTGVGVAVAGVAGWRNRERALRCRLPLPAPRALPWLAAAVAVVGLALAAYVTAFMRW